MEENLTLTFGDDAERVLLERERARLSVNVSLLARYKYLHGTDGLSSCNSQRQIPP